jgi:hypothetical protein
MGLGMELPLLSRSLQANSPDSVCANGTHSTQLAPALA